MQSVSFIRPPLGVMELCRAIVASYAQYETSLLS